MNKNHAKQLIGIIILAFVLPFAFAGIAAANMYISEEGVRLVVMTAIFFMIFISMLAINSLINHIFKDNQRDEK